MSTVETLLVQDLVIDYGGHPVVRGANLSIEPGEFVTLLGPSGSGKTSILRTVAGYVAPRSGDILINGKSVVRVPARMRNCGMVFQNYALFPHMTVAENVAYGLKTRGMPKADIAQRVAEMLDAVHLDGFALRRPHEMSGGQQQRVALARALVIRPALLLMDEPLAALDLRLREQMQVEIRRIQQQFGISTLYVTHDQGEAFTMSDRIMVMNQGHIVTSDRPRQVYLKPNCSFTARFVGGSTLLEIPLASAASESIRLPGLATAFRLAQPISTSTARIFVALRPDVLRCSAVTFPGATKGTVTARRFSGMHPMLMIECEGHEFLATDSGGHIKPGDHVWLSWQIDDAHPVEETEEGLTSLAEGQALIASQPDSPVAEAVGSRVEKGALIAVVSA